MPSTRRSSGGARPASNRQSTLSFNHRVTKSVPKSTKDLVSSAPSKQSPLSKHVKSLEEDDDEKVKNVTAPDVPAEEPKVEEDEEQEEEVEEQVAKVEVPAEKTEAELRAEKLSDRQIDQYWHKLEKERSAKRVHQEGLTIAEKVLRYFDVSSQYGPCVGITRMKRWQRADKLGLNPPLEVLALLIKEEQKGTTQVERAHMDEILNSTAVGTT